MKEISAVTRKAIKYAEKKIRKLGFKIITNKPYAVIVKDASEYFCADFYAKNRLGEIIAFKNIERGDKKSKYLFYKASRLRADTHFVWFYKKRTGFIKMYGLDEYVNSVSGDKLENFNEDFNDTECLAEMYRLLVGAGLKCRVNISIDNVAIDLAVLNEYHDIVYLVELVRTSNNRWSLYDDEDYTKYSKFKIPRCRFYQCEYDSIEEACNLIISKPNRTPN